MVRHLLAFSFTIACLLAGADLQADGIKIGERPAEKVNLRDRMGNSRVLDDFKGKATVVCFLGTECPLANLYVPRLVEMEARYRAQDVQFIAVFPNDSESLNDVAAFALDRNVPFPILKDFGQSFADQLGVARTPTVCVLDANLKLRYRGRIDDQYSPGSRQSEPKRKYLENAVGALLAGKSIEEAESIADGCLIRRIKNSQGDRTYTFHRDVERIVQNRCQACHRPGQAGPMSLLTYDDVSAHGEMVAEVIGQQRMPPWHADRRYGHFRNQRSLSKDEVAAILGWYSQGMPKGDEKDAPPSIAWSESWMVGKPDMVFELPAEVSVPAEGVVPYRYYFVPTGFKEDRWVTVAEARPGNPAVVHHVIVRLAAPGRASIFGDNNDTGILAIGGPGEAASIAQAGMAIRVPKDAELIFEVHYTPNGKATTDRSKVGITFAKSPPERELKLNHLGTERFRIPANNPHHKEIAEFTFPKDGQLVAVLPHMHVRGKAFQYEVTFPDGRHEIIAAVPRYDFNWQTNYVLEKPLAMPKGTKVRATAHWDNSRTNPLNPDPSKVVRFGLQTSEEMMFGFLSYVLDESPELQLPPRKPNLFALLMFRGLDKNKNGVAEPSELPKDMLESLRAEGIEVPAGLSPIGLEAILAETGSANN